MSFKVTEGWTGDLDFTLAVNGVARPWLGGDAVSLILKTQAGRRIKTVGNVAPVPEAPLATPPIGPGTVRYTPDASDLKAADSPVLARFKVVTGGRVVFFPNGEEDSWTVYVE